MKICIVTEFCTPYYTGGGEIKYHEIAKRLVKKGHQVNIICCRFKNAPKKEIRDGVKVYHLGPIIKSPPKRTVLNFMHYIWSCFLFLLREKCDLIESNTYIPLLPSFLASKIKKTPLVATIHIVIRNWKEDVYNPKIASIVEKFLLKLPYDQIVALSDYEKDELVNYFRISRSKIKIIPMGVDIHSFDAIKIRKKEEKTIIFVGRLVWFKHIEDLVEAIAILRKDIQNIKLKIIGDGVMMTPLRKKVKRLNLTNHINILGKKNFQLTIREIKKSSVLVLPSTKDTFGMVLIEAGAAKIPVVAYNSGGPKDIIIDGKNGLLAKPRNINDLALKLKKLISNKKLLKEMGEKGREIIEEKYTWDKITDETERLYFNTIKKVK